MSAMSAARASRAAAAAAGDTAPTAAAPTAGAGSWTNRTVGVAVLLGSVAAAVYLAAGAAAAAQQLRGLAAAAGTYDGPLLHVRLPAARVDVTDTGPVAEPSSSSSSSATPTASVTATSTGTPAGTPAATPAGTTAGTPAVTLSTSPTAAPAAPQPLVAVAITAAAQKYGAACLDGTLPTLLFGAGVGAGAHNWVLFFSSGGFCMSEADCGARAATVLGTAAPVGKHTWYHATVADANCDVNPLTCTWNRVVVPYCDGTMLTSNRASPYNNTVAAAAATAPLVHMRGHAILRAVLEAIATDALPATTPWRTARRFMVTGCSAGGATSLLHGDFIRDTLVTPLRAAQAAAGDTVGATSDFSIVAWAGLLFARNSAAGEPAFPAAIAAVASTGAAVVTNAACAAAFPGATEAWRCLDPATAYGFIDSRVWVDNSLYDHWSLRCGLAAHFTPDKLHCNWNTSWVACLSNLAVCSSAQLAEMDAYRGELETAVRASRTYAKPGNGGFMHSCRTHCNYPDVYPNDTMRLTHVPADGGLVGADAFAAWLGAPTPNAPPDWRWDCDYSSGAPCNPTCPPDHIPWRLLQPGMMAPATSCSGSGSESADAMLAAYEQPRW